MESALAQQHAGGAPLPEPAPLQYAPLPVTGPGRHYFASTASACAVIEGNIPAACCSMSRRNLPPVLWRSRRRQRWPCRTACARSTGYKLDGTQMAGRAKVLLAELKSKTESVVAAQQEAATQAGLVQTYSAEIKELEAPAEVLFFSGQCSYRGRCTFDWLPQVRLGVVFGCHNCQRCTLRHSRWLC